MYTSNATPARATGPIGVDPTPTDRATAPTTEIVLPGVGDRRTLLVRRRTLADPGRG